MGVAKTQRGVLAAEHNARVVRAAAVRRVTGATPRQMLTAHLATPMYESLIQKYPIKVMR
jgi:hypothetical protein